MILLAFTVAFAEEPAQVEAAPPTEAAAPPVAPPVSRSPEEVAFLDSLHWRQGDVVLGDGLATLTVPATLRFLDSADAARVLEQAWGNPPGSVVLGMLFDVDRGPLDDGGWGVVVEYEDSGHVSDEDAATIDFSDVLKSMQQSAEDANAQRAKDGYPAVHLLGWAEPPHYDAATRKVYWARELDFAGTATHSLNYDVRVLGRDGVLSLSAVAGIDQLAEVKPAMEKIIGLAEFSAGHRYEEFDPSTDRAAAYGLAGLVAGGIIASKTGLLKGILVALLASKKLVIAGVVGLGAMAKGYFGRVNEPPKN